MQVLSPAGSLESFYSALNNGADEIYMGINAFNARAKADDIDNESLRKAIEDAHILGVKVFCTLNTLIFDEELEKVCETIVKAINFGFDAFIVQDLAVIALIKSIKKDAVLHFSTQMGIHNSFGAIMAKKMGASRIVLSRECSLSDIKAIKNAVPDMEIEYFVQGALCVAFSGNCYLSNRLLGKSGNRGECAQLCRLPYQAKIQENGKEIKIDKAFYLSTGDLCLFKHLKELKEAGVDSLKIEGRLRRPSYVGKATEFYRKAVDYLNLSDEKSSIENKVNDNSNQNYGITNIDLEELKTTFNRGNFLYDAYLNEKDYNNIIYSKMQNHMGIKIGKVIFCEKFKNINKIILQLDRQIYQNDGLKIMRDGKEVSSLGVGNVEMLGRNTIIYSKQKLCAGDSVHLIHSENLEKRLTGNKRQCKIDFEIVLKENERAVIKAVLKSFNNLSFYAYSANFLEKAINSAVSNEDVIQSISKINDPIFCVREIKTTLDNVFMAKSALNALRREVMEKVREHFSKKQIEVQDYCKIIETAMNEICAGKIECNVNEEKENKLKAESDYNHINICKLTLVRELCGEMAKAENVAYFPYDFLSNSTFEEIRSYLECGAKDKNKNLYIFLPPFVLDKDLTLWQEKMVASLGQFKDRIVVIGNNISHMHLCEHFKVIAGDFCNIANRISASFYKALGASGVCLGYEFKDRDFSPKDFNIDYKIVGNNILCFMLHCPFKVVTQTRCDNCQYCQSLSYSNDRGVQYKIGKYKFSRCYFYLFN